ncbi:LytR C-terminal domain-containing protein [Aeromicrobium terrae]|uniref:LytR family transcriptional regulator n=1 Tax=Aeromicrobium terrae TaxID=2498846 RepID=A0A5C8NFK6_9ACTN|nr:LytR C-terminal domain-containing protein [Aeromicrobium terrae]TXL60674.1 LytR family transcriptional regulator [Aeromicrobium terrae]
MTSRHPALVMTAAVAVFLLGSFYGFRLLTADADTGDEGPSCDTRTVAAGDDLTSNLVAVDVYNASQRAGLANRVSINLQRRGFLAGKIANSTSKVQPKVAAILTTDRDDPRVKLVAQQLGPDVELAEPDIPVDDNVVVVVGDDYKKLAKAQTKVQATSAVTVCVPIVKIP